jgi:DNA-binding NtrC family response regulator
LAGQRDRRGGAQQFDGAHYEAHAWLAFSPGANVKVLLVEADVALRGSLATLLMNVGITVHQAGNATEALSLAPAIGHHDMLIIAHDLGENVSGFDLAGRIRERRPLAPLILICSQSRATPVFAIGPSDRLLAMPFGADSLLLLMRQMTDVCPGVAATSDTFSDEVGVRGNRESVYLVDNGEDRVRRSWLPTIWRSR